MDKFGLYKKVTDPVLPETIELVKEFDTKTQADAAKTKHKDTANTHFYVAELKK